MQNKIIQGDCLDVMKDIADNSIDLVLTDPPYNIARKNNFHTMGSGTTCVACKELNRNCIGIEIDEKYYNIANERINNVKCK